MFLLFLPFKDTFNLLVSAISVLAPSTTKSTPSIFDESKQSAIQAVDNKIPSSEIEYPSLGTEYGVVIIDKFNVQAKLIYGDSQDDLREGVGHFNGSIFTRYNINWRT